MKKRTKTVYALAAAFFLTGCANDGIADALKSTDAIEPEENTLLSELNKVTKQEKALQETFEKTLDESDSLTQFSDGTAPVFENVKNRKTAISAIKKATGEMKETQKSLAENDGDKVPKEEIEGLSEEIKKLTTSLDDYSKQYEKNLKEEETYYQSLADEEATYKTLTDGITKLNEEDTKTKELLNQLNEQFKTLKKQRTEAEEKLNSLSESSK